jgi:protein-L-isoaspartate(D-aspartate) O-methyltransferase
MGTISKAFTEIDRADFLPPVQADGADIDAPLPIGFGQTNSQPSTVRMMLERLEVEPGNKILDVGSGSGWTSALLARLTGPKGFVYAVEAIPELLEFGHYNCRRVGIENVRFHQAGQQYGLPGHGPYERILVSAAARALPLELLKQLKPGGKMVIPVRNNILEIEKGVQGQINTDTHSGFAFVPLIQPV